MKAVGSEKQGLESPNIVQVIGGVFIGAPGNGHVEDADASGLKRALDLPNKLVGVKGVVKHIGKLEIKSVVSEGLAVKVAPNNEGRVGDQVDAQGVGDSDAFESLDLLADPSPDAEGFGGVGEQALVAQIGEEAGEDVDLSVPVAGGPYLTEIRVEGFVELALDVGVVGGVAGSDSDIII